MLVVVWVGAVVAAAGVVVAVAVGETSVKSTVGAGVSVGTVGGTVSVGVGGNTVGVSGRSVAGRGVGAIVLVADSAKVEAGVWVSVGVGVLSGLKKINPAASKTAATTSTPKPPNIPNINVVLLTCPPLPGPVAMRGSGPV